MEYLNSLLRTTKFFMLFMNSSNTHTTHVCEKIFHIKVVNFHPLHHILNICLTTPMVNQFEKYRRRVRCSFKNRSTKHLRKRKTDKWDLWFKNATHTPLTNDKSNAYRNKSLRTTITNPHIASTKRKLRDIRIHAKFHLYRAVIKKMCVAVLLTSN